MKTKILTYANDGNTVCNKFMDIFPVSYCENIFTTCPDEYQRVSLIFKFKNIYYCEGNYSNDQIANNPDTVLNHYNTYLPGLVTHKWIKSIYITLYESLGMDAGGLIAARTQIQEQRQIEKQGKELEKQKNAEDQKQKRLNELTEAKSKLTAGERIDKTDFLDLIRLYNIPLHIRTIGMLNKLNKVEIGLTGAYIYGSNAKKANLQKAFEAAKILSNS